MSSLTPSQAAQIASGVYLLRTNTVSDLHDQGQSLGCEELFRVDNSSRFQGQSGALAWKALSGFGYIAEGKGPCQGDILLVTRGTAMALDWLTNLNMAMETGPSGHLVHAGFNRVWKSFSADIQNFLRGRNPTAIHCVGHSLGGALATLNADYLSQVKAGQVNLYTFGMPRTGIFPFSVALTRRLGQEHIHRVSHPADPVPMIPIFPFLHLPHDTEGIILPRGRSGLISGAAHSMKDSYIPGVADFTWDGLAAASRGPSWDRQIIAWLEQSSLGGNGLVMGSAKLLLWISKALLWILARAKDLIVAAVGTVLTVGATVLDQMAWLLARGAEISIAIAQHMKTLIGAIFRFLGRGVMTGVSLTATFLRWVLSLLFDAISGVALRALLTVV